ncbi:transposase [Labrys portucalensis]|uniref:Transposase n=1 Tax=Labrys neptuniae TaxID=376174 RepID=A0ABV6ZN33_9HYPH
MSILYAGLDVSLELTSICVVTAEGSIFKEAKVASDPEAISMALLELDASFERIGLEAGPLSQWLFFGLRDAGLPVCCIETRHSKAAIAAMSLNKTDRNDARSIAQLYGATICVRKCVNQDEKL